MPEDRLLRCGQVLPFRGPGVSAWQSRGTLHDTQAEGSFPVGLCASSVGGCQPVSWPSQRPSRCPGGRLPKSWGTRQEPSARQPWSPVPSRCSRAPASSSQLYLPARLGPRPRWDAGTLTGGRCFSRSVPSRTLCHSPRGGGCPQPSYYYLLCGRCALQTVTCSVQYLLC